jgi:hypothetical protein
MAQGSGAQLDQLTPSGQEFKHPEDLYDPTFLCTNWVVGNIALDQDQLACFPIA